MAAKKFLVDLDLDQNALVNAAFENLASAPGSPVQGQTYYDTNDESLHVDKSGGFSKLLDSTDLIDDDTFATATATNIPSAESVVAYVSSRISGLQWLSARAASTANVVIATDLENGDTLDGVTLATGDTVLLKDQTVATENGLYIVAASGAASRASYTGAELSNKAIIVNEGTTNESSAWIIANNAITFGVTSIVVVSFSASSVPDATTTVKGKVELATQAETQAKTDTVRAVTPSGLADFSRKYAAAISASTGATVSAATHGLGATSDLMVMLYEGSGPYVPVDASVSIASNGDVTWATNSSLTGRIVIIG